jgi:hypothetical protein
MRSVDSEVIQIHFKLERKLSFPYVNAVCTLINTLFRFLDSYYDAFQKNRAMQAFIIKHIIGRMPYGGKECHLPIKLS